MSIQFNGKFLTTWEDVEQELFTSEEIAESHKRVQNIEKLNTTDLIFLSMCLNRYLTMEGCPESEQSKKRLQDILVKLDAIMIYRLEKGE